MNRPARLGVLISGGGSNLQAIIDACSDGILKGSAVVAVVISNRADAFGLERARRAAIPAQCIDPKKFSSRTDYYSCMLSQLTAHNVDIVCLAGYLLKIEQNMLDAYCGRILNIHPALLPRFGGPGMFGHHVHHAVIDAHELVSGATVHFVDSEYDHGPVIAQQKVPVAPGETPETLACKVLAVEHSLFPNAIYTVIQRFNGQQDSKITVEGS
ncbi:MAG: phosphoribosylglycinamide formyltransferase [Endomicrobiales bacterium]